MSVTSASLWKACGERAGFPVSTRAGTRVFSSSVGPDDFIVLPDTRVTINETKE
jgi:CDP-diacylglycerol pyrophosphatase